MANLVCFTDVQRLRSGLNAVDWDTSDSMSVDVISEFMGKTFEAAHMRDLWPMQNIFLISDKTKLPSTSGM